MYVCICNAASQNMLQDEVYNSLHFLCININWGFIHKLFLICCDIITLYIFNISIMNGKMKPQFYGYNNSICDYQRFSLFLNYSHQNRACITIESWVCIYTIGLVVDILEIYVKLNSFTRAHKCEDIKQRLFGRHLHLA